jgi:hypothetical protein
METCLQFLQQYDDGVALLQHIVTGDETWVHHYEPAGKHQNIEWKHIITQDQEVWKCAFYWQSDVDAVLGLYSV